MAKSSFLRNSIGERGRSFHCSSQRHDYNWSSSFLVRSKHFTNKFDFLNLRSVIFQHKIKRSANVGGLGTTHRFT